MVHFLNEVGHTADVRLSASVMKHPDNQAIRQPYCFQQAITEAVYNFSQATLPHFEERILLQIFIFLLQYLYC